MTDLAAVVLCGGRSSRMGRPKAWLDFGGEMLLLRVVRVVSETAAPVVVVASPKQSLPELPPEVIVEHDPVEGLGPLQGIAVGLRAVAERAPFAFVCSTDTPFLAPAYVRRMRALCEGFEAAAPSLDGHHEPLAAVYATNLHQRAQALVDTDQRGSYLLLERSHSNLVDRATMLRGAELAAADPRLRSLLNVNTPEELSAALDEAGHGRR